MKTLNLKNNELPGLVGALKRNPRIQESKSPFLGNRESEREANRITESDRSECFWELKIETESANQPNQNVSGNF